MTRLNLALVPAIAGLCLFSSTIASERPNIVVFIADDLGPDGIGIYRAFDHEEVVLPPGEDPTTWSDPWGRRPRPSSTPHLDQLAREGLRFTRCHATGICSPSRAQYATGQYPFRNGTLDIDGSGYRSDPNKSSVTQLLRDAGYVTAKTGKADIDHLTSTDERFTGWQYWRETGDQLSVVGPSTVTAVSDYFPDLQILFAQDFIRRNKPTAANEFRPFYLLFGFNLPHVPIEPTSDSFEVANPSLIPAGETTAQRVFRHYSDGLRFIDKTVGAVLDELDAQGLADNTIVIFTGDNGSLGSQSGARLQGRLWDERTSTFRFIDGAKADRTQNREGSTLVPFILRWPSVIEPARRGSVREELIDFTDFLPTFADVTGEAPPADWELHGHSIAPLLRGDSAYVPRRWVYTQIENNWCVRGPNFRLNRDGRFFDMSEAPFRMTLVNSPTLEQQAIRDEYQSVLDTFDPVNGPTYEGHQDVQWNNPAADWKRIHFGATGRWETPTSGDRSDPDGDGVPNIFERAFGWNPRNGTDVMPPIEFAGDVGSVSVPTLQANDTRIMVEGSIDLSDWTAATAAGGPPFQFSESPPAGAPAFFMRLRAERVTPWNEP